MNKDIESYKIEISKHIKNIEGLNKKNESMTQ